MLSQSARLISLNHLLACAALVTLAACNRGVEPAAQSTELAWARAALERNPQLELVASDPQAGVFTVRNRSTGEVQAVKLAELAAAPLSQLKALEPRAAVPTQTPAAATAFEQPASATVPAEPARVATPAAEPAATVPANGGAQTASENYTIKREGGQIRVSGPGVSIVSSGTSGVSGTLAEAGQRTVEPIICEGRRMVHLDSRSIYVDGNAITARGGCELYITNSRIVASGTGIVVQDAVVHVSNSHIEGANGSFEADDRARMFVRGSTFQGVPRRTELAMVQDQGGNRWR